MTVMILLSILFVALNGYFVAAEFALVKTRPSRVEALAASGDKRAKRLLLILDELDLYLSACQLGITISSLVLGYLAEPAFAALLESIVIGLGWAAPDSAVLHAVSFGVALTVVTILHMVLGEQAPKVWAIDAAERAALKFAGPLRLYTMLFKPLIVLINVMSNGLLRILGIKGGHGEHDADIRELKTIIGAAAAAGNISRRQRVFAENIIDLVDLDVRHVMVPRLDIASLDIRAPLADNLELVRNQGHSRWPLCDGSLDELRGIVHSRDLLNGLLSEGSASLKLTELARTALVVPDVQPLTRFIIESQQSGQQAAMVTDEHGTIVGMAFLEDALEEIVGPLRDEHDVVEETSERNDDGVIELSGSMALPEARDLLGFAGDDTFDTIGGLIIARLGRLPHRGDELELPPYTVRVVRVGRRRQIERLRFEPTVAPDSPAEPADAAPASG